MTLRAVVATTGDRPEYLFACLNSLRKYQPNIPVTLVGQEVPDEVRDRVESEGGVRAIWEPKKRGPHSAKVTAFKSDPSVEVWVSLDDDMEVLPETDYVTPARECLRKGVGLVACNWVRSEVMLPKKRAAMSDKFQDQPIVFTGGGLLLARTVAHTILEMPDVPYVCDNTSWSVAAYSKGYINKRYLGSLAIHRVCSTGGRRAFLMDNRGVPIDPNLVNLREPKTAPYPFPENNYLVPSGGDVTDAAKDQHASARRVMMSP